jgi:hypothetical protein
MKTDSKYPFETFPEGIQSFCEEKRNLKFKREIQKGV